IHFSCFFVRGIKLDFAIHTAIFKDYFCTFHVIVHWFSGLLFLIRSAPEGHLPTWSISSCVVALAVLIQGSAMGLYTAGNVRTQMPEWIHSLGFQTMVVSPFSYSCVSMLVKLN